MIGEVVARIIEAQSSSPRRPFVVGVAGGVGVGKTTLSTQLGDRLRERQVSTAVLATDNFLFPNDELGRRGRLMQKGFPDTYDVELLRTAVADLRSGRVAAVPVYSHERYDRSDGTVSIPPTDVLILEGVNVLQPEVVTLLDLAIYIDVEEGDARQWFFRRFAGLAAAGEGFYAAFATMTEEERLGVAESAWSGINLINLREHIAPTIDRADLVIRKAADHSVIDIRQAKRE